ncbi:sensor domain-containing diguanylate cyclase [Dokdonella ginsengisoli]|uniref:diguanylate cyclase n=1 Tax=Dokdonella ginsengisoli TaxID=363846 RepID=A0ABV9QRZ2_9GAMM
MRAQSVAVVVERLDAPRDLAVDAAAVIAGTYDGDFVAQTYAAITPSHDHPVWYRIRLAEDWAGRDLPVLSIFDPQGLSVTAYLPPEHVESRHSIYSAGANAGFTRHALVFDLPRALKAAAPVYLKVAPDKAVPRRIEVTQQTDALVRDLGRARLDVLFPAVQVAAVLVMLCFFLALRERMYMYFVGHVVFVVLYELYLFGIGYEYAPFKLLAPLGSRAVWLNAAIAIVLMLEFSRQFLELARFAPRLDALLRFGRWPLAALALVAAVPSLTPDWTIEYALAALLLLSAPLLIVAGLLAWQQGSRRGGFFLCAWIPGLLFVILRALQLFLQWPLPVWLEFAMPAAFAYASLVLAYGLADHTLAIRHERDVAHRLAEHDALTGVLNRRAILARLRAGFLQARESGEPLSLLFLDLDHFKRINDSYGHHVGDQCLRSVVGPINSELRQGDALGRYGGEEFLVVLPGAGAEDAETVAERIRKRIETMPMLVSGQRIGLTLSIGIAAVDAEVMTPNDLIERADVALYRSKSGGRNLVSTHDGAMPLGEAALDR